MSSVLSYTPPWLNRPHPGSAVFESAQQTKHESSSKAARHTGVRRTIARRGTEIFVASGTQIRWADLVYLKEQYEEGDQQEEELSYYRTLKVPAPSDIKTLAVSPSGDYIAFATSHTVHVSILPASSHLTSEDTSPLKLKSFQIGPTDHVLEASSIASILWHPFGYRDACLTTVTQSGIVRLWDLDRDNRWSFNQPTVALDLKKLANAKSATQDLSPWKYGMSQGFSPDTVEFEIASACFGGSGSDMESGWATMTLWLATRGGDIYALAPLLSKKWQCSEDSFQTLSRVLDTPKSSAPGLLSSTTLSGPARALIDEWIAANADTAVDDDFGQLKIFHQPEHLASTPQLQGPLGILPDGEDVYDVSDIHVFAAFKNQQVPLVEESEEHDTVLNTEDTPFGLIALATNSGLLHLLLDIDGIKPKWLPTKSNRPSTPSTGADPENIDLLLVESLQFGDENAIIFPAISEAVDSKHGMFISHACGVSFIDASSWVRRFSEEISKAVVSGCETRLDILLNGVMSKVQHPIRIENPYAEDAAKALLVPAVINFYDSDLGNFLLTSTGGQAQAAVLESKDDGIALLERTIPGINLNDDDDDEIKGPEQEPRPSYQPAEAFWQQSTLKQAIERHYTGRRHMMESEIVISEATEQALLSAHRVLGDETEALSPAVADLFRRCEALLAEFQGQIEEVRIAKEKIDSILDDDADDYENREGGYGISETVENRLTQAAERQEHLERRQAELKRRLHQASAKSLSDAETSWIRSIDHMDTTTLASDLDDSETLVSRLDKLKTLKEELAASVKQHTGHAIPRKSTDEMSDISTFASPHRRSVRKDKVAIMLERESALVEAIQQKLARLKTWSVEV